MSKAYTDTVYYDRGDEGRRGFSSTAIHVGTGDSITTNVTNYGENGFGVHLVFGNASDRRVLLWNVESIDRMIDALTAARAELRSRAVEDSRTAEAILDPDSQRLEEEGDDPPADEKMEMLREG